MQKIWYSLDRWFLRYASEQRYRVDEHTHVLIAIIRIPPGDKIVEAKQRRDERGLRQSTAFVGFIFYYFLTGGLVCVGSSIW